jgi:hypothetical protein
MNPLRAVAVVVLSLAVVVAAGYALFAFVLVSSDTSSYTANTTVDYEFDEVLANAEDRGYDVRTIDSSGYHPEGIERLDAELGPNYDVVRVVFYHDDGARFEANVFADEGKTELVVFGPADDLPEDWLVGRIQLVLGVDEATAREYVDEMRAATTDDDLPIPQTYATEQVRFAQVYAEFDGANRTVETGGTGQGWVEYHYAVDGAPFGELHFVAERAELTHREGRFTYVLNVDRVDGVGITVRGPANAELSDAELREGVSARFVEVGLPAEAVDDLTFEYEPSVW